MYKYIVLMTIYCACVIQRGMCQKEVGDPCMADTVRGTCKKATECPELGEDLKKGKKPEICGFVGNTAVVCCRTTISEPTSTSKPKHPMDDYDYGDYEISPKVECEPIPSNATKVQKRGKKAWDNCIDFLEYVYPCEVTGTLSARREMARRYMCNHEVTGLVVGGNDTADREFPHMALLGYGSSESKASWQCGGTVISENFVMTAGHCTVARDLGNVTFIRVGLTKLSSPMDPSRLHRVAEIIKHNDYKPPSNYNDLALLRTETKIKLDDRVYPACLHFGNTVNDANLVATGWGLLNYQGSPSDTLQKVTLERFTTEECKEAIPPSRKLLQGILPESQLCAGHHTEHKDTCQGDSGGPLQIYNLDVNCMYTVVGVTSFGRGCGTIGAPGVYTRVSQYVPWIESIVWP